MDWQRDLAGLVAGLVVATATAPVGVSGAVFLLPFQLSVLHVPNPRVTPTNLLYNVLSGPGALLRYRRRGGFDRDLAGQLVSGAVPGVVAGSAVRVFLASDPDVFRVLAAAVLAPVGLLVLRGPRPAAEPRTFGPAAVRGLALVVGTAGGIYGIGGGSLVGPVLVGAGMSVVAVAPAALLSTWVTSVVGVLTYVLLAALADGAIAPDWSLGVAIGLGGLVGGWIGAGLQPHLPERALRAVLGVLALALAVLYVVQVVG
jgi:uncharacterized membrane protein YfcA